MTDKKTVLELESKDTKVTTTESTGPKEFFKTRPGLYVWSDFADRILSKAEAVPAPTKFNLQTYKLTKYAQDSEIEAELPEKHIFSESEVCALIAEFVSKQPKGEAGTLDNDGNWNLFYTPEFVVSVYWYSGGSEWSVRAWRRGSGGWDGGSRVFSPAN